LSAENYFRFPDFQRRVLDVAMSEINNLSDINVTYSTIKDGKKFAKIEFVMNIKRDTVERLKTYKNIEEIIGSK
jgi:plasmid replication initiation protein